MCRFLSQILLINLHIWVCAASERSRNASTPELGDLPQQFSIFIRNLVVHVSKEQNSPSLYWIGPSIFYRNGHKRLLNHEILSLCTHSTNSALSRTRKFDRHASRGVNKNFHLVSLLEIGLTKYNFSTTSPWLLFFVNPISRRGTRCKFLFTPQGALIQKRPRGMRLSQ